MSKEKIKIFTNQVYPAWEPDDLQNFLGGSEELIIYLAEGLTRANYDVEVYHSARSQDKKVINDVVYYPREQAKCDSNDIFITFKDNTPWLNGARGKLNIHLTADIESSWGMNPRIGKMNIESIDHFVNISHYQRRKNIFVPFQKEHAFPLGVDIESLDRNKQDQISDTLLYCSSPDRGLIQLLTDWQAIKQKQPQFKLKIAYGWRYFNFQNLQLRQFKNKINELVKQPDIEYMGTLTKDEIEREYWKAQYWILPLNNPDSELFCLNAVKSQYCECVPIVNKIGALTETVGDYIPYQDLRAGKMTIKPDKGVWSKAKTWDEMVNKYWLPEILKGVQ